MRSILLALAIGALGACAAPGSWDGIAGGTTEDPSLSAPRQMSPLTVTTVATFRPRMKWELQGESTGAIVELSKTRAFDGEIKSYDAKGARELVVPEDLEAGIWFWRLRGRTDAKTGTQFSKVWEVLVRGPASNGISDVPTGSVFDVDGDGQPDLILSADWAEDPRGADMFPMVMLAKGKDGQLVLDEKNYIQLNDYALTSQMVVLAGGTDFDGDGFADMVDGYESPAGVAGSLAPAGGYVFVDMGDPKGISYDRYVDIQQEWQKVPGIHAAGDVNGDGYGDLLFGAINGSSLGLGSSQGPVALITSISLPQDQVLVDTKPRALIAGFDANGDGLADFVTAPVLSKAIAGGVNHAHTGSDVPTTDATGTAGGGGEAIPLRFTPGSADLQIQVGAEELKINNNQSSVNRAAAFAAGDFNGDALPDVASTVVANGVRQVCIWYGDRVQKLIAGPCVTAPDNDMLFGESLTSGDLEAGGKETLLITSAAGVRAARIDGTTLTADAVVAPGYGTTLTTIWPGRPGKARWAAVSAAGDQVGVFEGTELKSTVRAPREVVSNFGRAMR